MEQRKSTELFETPKKPSLGATAGATASPEVADVIKSTRVKAGIPGAGASSATDFLPYTDIPWEVRDPSQVELIPWLSEEAA